MLNLYLRIDWRKQFDWLDGFALAGDSWKRILNWNYLNIELSFLELHVTSDAVTVPKHRRTKLDLDLVFLVWDSELESMLEASRHFQQSHFVF